MVLRCSIGTIPGAILTADAGILFEPDDPGLFIFFVGVDGTANEAGRFQTVIAGHGDKVATGTRTALSLKFSHPAPNHIHGSIVLFVAGHFTAFASHALGHVEVKAILFPLREGDLGAGGHYFVGLI
jgi:hypothetical protein